MPPTTRTSRTPASRPSTTGRAGRRAGRRPGPRAPPSPRPGGLPSGAARTVALAASAIRARNYAAAARAAFCGTAAHMGESEAQEVDLAAIGHGALDLLGFIPGIGAAADVANGLWYAAEGNYVDAAMSFVSAVPGVGDAAGAAKVGAKAGLAALEAADAATAAARAAKKLEAVHGNSKLSTKPQHLYEIYDTRNGDVVKTGISGRPLNQNGPYCDERSIAEVGEGRAGTPMRLCCGASAVGAGN